MVLEASVEFVDEFADAAYVGHVVFVVGEDEADHVE